MFASVLEGTRDCRGWSAAVEVLQAEVLSIGIFTEELGVPGSTGGRYFEMQKGGKVGSHFISAWLVSHQRSRPDQS